MKYKFLIILLFCKNDIYSASKSRSMIESMQTEVKMFAENNDLTIKKLLATYLPVQTTVICRSKNKDTQAKPRETQDILADLVCEYAQSDFKINDKIELSNVPNGYNYIESDTNCMIASTNFLLTLRKINDKWQILQKFLIKGDNELLYRDENIINRAEEDIQIWTKNMDGSYKIDYVLNPGTKDFGMIYVDEETIVSLGHDLRFWKKKEYNKWQCTRIETIELTQNKSNRIIAKIDKDTFLVTNNSDCYMWRKNEQNNWECTLHTKLRVEGVVHSTRSDTTYFFTDENGSIFVYDYQQESNSFNFVQEIKDEDNTDFLKCFMYNGHLIGIGSNFVSIYKKINDKWYNFKDIVNLEDEVVNKVLFTNAGLIILSGEKDLNLELWVEFNGDYVRISSLKIENNNYGKFYDACILDDNTLVVTFENTCLFLSQSDGNINYKSEILSNMPPKESKKMEIEEVVTADKQSAHAMEEVAYIDDMTLAQSMHTQTVVNPKVPTLLEMEEAAKIHKATDDSGRFAKRRKLDPDGDNCRIM